MIISTLPPPRPYRDLGIIHASGQDVDPDIAYQKALQGLEAKAVTMHADGVFGVHPNTTSTALFTVTLTGTAVAFV